MLFIISCGACIFPFCRLTEARCGTHKWRWKELGGAWMARGQREEVGALGRSNPEGWVRGEWLWVEVIQIWKLMMRGPTRTRRLWLSFTTNSRRNNTLTERALNNSHKLRIHPFDEISRAESARRVWPAQLQTSYGWSYIDCTYPERSSNKPDQLGAR